MAPIVPRWEWRTFGAQFGIAERKFAELTPGAVQESDELYFLGGSGDANAKVRNDLLDIKVLREVNADGLERWEPVMKQPFPIPAADVAKVFASVGMAAPEIDRQTYNLDQFADVFIARSGAQAVEVHKRRVRYTVGGCTSELTDVQAGGRQTRTIAIEGEDADAVLAAVASVGLRGFFNMNYELGLRALLDDAPERFAVIDVGTNSVKLHVAERTADGSWHMLVDRAELTRLGEGLEKGGEITHEAVERTANVMLEMSIEAKRNGVRALVAAGTAGLRIARNSATILDEIRARTGISIEVIPGAEEGRLAYLAAKAGLRMPKSALVVFDTGGGSTQFTFGQGSHVDEQFSVNVGAVRYTEQFELARAVAPEVLRAALEAIAADLSRIEGRPRADALVAMGGALTNMAAVMHGLAKYDPDVVQGTVLNRAEIDRQIEMYRSRDSAERLSIIGLQPKRAEVILAGACIVKTVMDKLGQGSLTVSDRGLRHGILVERFGGGP
jgi:exopolyphosphatase / guanosine-5'-triphosphate,3'-diphosphate pyrophosphatase